jgi:hypothetical protein
MVLSGFSLHARCAPGAPGCLPGFRLPSVRRPGCAGCFLPGWSSDEGGSEEFPLFREACRSSRATRPDSSATCASSTAILASRSSSSARSFPFAARSLALAAASAMASAGASGVPGTPELQQSWPSVSNTTPA